MHNRTMLMAASTLATLLAWSGVAAAQDDQAATKANQSTMVQELVVTAQKREQRLQDVPLSITAVTGEDISRRGVTSLIDLQYSVPGLSAIQYGPGQERVQLRGISDTYGLPTTGRYLDEMPINIDAQGLGLDLRLLDMERIEVLRGPQGTLYGEGSMGGTIRYLTANPDLTRYGADLETRLGSVTDGGTSWRASAVLNAPLVEDRLGLRLVAGYEKDAGWIDSLVTGQKDINDAEIYTVRGKLLAKLGDNLEASLLVMHQENDQAYQNFGIDRKSSALVQELNNSRYDLVNGVVKWDLGGAELVESIGWTEFHIHNQNDVSSTYVPLIGLFGFPPGFVTSAALGAPSTVRTWTDELRLASKPGSPIDWTVGLYGRDSQTATVADIVTAPGQLPFTLLHSEGAGGSRSWAAFGEAGWHATSQLTLSAGLRYFSDKRTTDTDTISFGLPYVEAFDATFTSLNPHFNVSYEFSPVSMVYFNVAKGFRSGGFNSQAAAPPGVTIPLTYQPETLWTYEAGTKQQWFDRRLIFEGAVFYNDWTDVQSTFFIPGSILAAITNGGKVQGWGVDASLTARPVAGLTLVGTYGWNNMEYKTLSAEKAPGDPVDFAVRETWSLSADYRRPLSGEVQGFVRLDYQHAGVSSIIFRNFGSVGVIPGHGMLNARIGIDFGRFEASLFADNLTDNKAPLLPTGVGVTGQAVEQTPRTVGINLKAHF